MQRGGPTVRRAWWLASAVCLLAILPAAASETASDDRLDRLEQRVSRLESVLSELTAQLARLVVTGEGDDAGIVQAVARETTELEGLSRELATATTEPLLPPPAAPVQPSGTSGAGEVPLDTSERVSYGGYMEMHYNNGEFEPEALDLHRFVLLYGHRFSDSISFVGEVEIEHALVEGGEESGELEIEQAYLDFLLGPSWSVRAGMMLTPMGILNEQHEPATFNGVERPFVDTFIVPSTWFANGAGVVGRFGNGFTLKAYLQSTLNASFFRAEEGWREGRQKGFIDDFTEPAAVVRLEYAGLPGLDLGASAWTGRTGFEFPEIAARGTMLELDARYSIGRFDLRGQVVTTELDDTARLNRAIQGRFGVNPNIAEEMRGHYVEGGFHLFPRRRRDDLVAFYRFERFDTQHKMAPGFLPLRQFNRSAHTVGLTFLPLPDVAIKVDYSFLDNESSFIEEGDRWNLGLGWWF